MLIYIGMIQGDLTVLASLETRSANGCLQYLCKCVCGNEVVMTSSNINRGNKTCGSCSYQITHKDAYMSWHSMKQRCNDANCANYYLYGGRGITYCERWKKFTNFLEDMGDPPVEVLSGRRFTLDRIDVNGNYSKENCRWSTASEQISNQRPRRKTYHETI